jgi:pyruvyltransferase
MMTVRHNRRRAAHHVELFSWNPRIRRGRISRHIPVGPRFNNFGDLLGPVIVNGMKARLGLEEAPACRSTRLFSVGSVIHFASSGDVVWGSGVNGTWLSANYSAEVDIRALRGPVSRQFLRERTGMRIPDVYGDPALLLPLVRPDLTTIARTIPVTVVSNLNESTVLDVPPDLGGVLTLSPRAPLEECLKTIASSQLVVGTSLHAIVVAEALGIPACSIAPLREGTFKYRDYYEGTGRRYSPAGSLADAIERGGDAPPRWDPSQLIDAFPRELWAPVGAEQTARRFDLGKSL